MPGEDSRGSAGGEFGALLRRHRRTAGLSQEALAELAGLSVDGIAALERGRRRVPRPITVRLLADALRLDGAALAEFTAAARDGTGAPLAPFGRPPAPADEFVGRTVELAEADQLLSAARLVTLTGPSGVGKTRLALAVANRLGRHFSAGVCWVSLAPLAAGSLVAPALAAALGVRAAASGIGPETIADHVAEHQLLLVLDNCEHVLDDCARLCATLLSRCPQLRVLATSRELLHVPGEVVQPVRPLLPPQADAAPDEMRRSPAVRLFVSRAAARGMPSAGERLVEATRVVRRLDGIPLAIELAAARTNVLTVGEIAAELESSFRILADRARTTPRRHRTLCGAIQWSYDLLTDAERRLFQALSVFAAGWSLPAVEAVYGEGSEVLDLLGRLADKSLILVRHDRPAARYDMLAVIREFAYERLIGSGLRDEVERRHAHYYLGLAERAEPELRGERQPVWLERLETELDNLRAAVAWLIRHQDARRALWLTGALWTFCYLRGHYAEGRQWLGQALELADRSKVAESMAPARAKALLGVGVLAFLQCDYDLASDRIEAALELFRALDDSSGTALALQRLGSIARERADYDTAEDLHRRSLDLFTRIADPSGAAWARNHLGFVAWLRRDLDTAERHCTRALADFRDIGDGEGIAWSLISLGSVALYAGRTDHAAGLLQDSLELSQRLGYREGVAWSLNQLGLLEARRGRTERALHLLDESLAEHRELGDRWRAASVIEELAAVAHQRTRTEYAAYLLGAASALREAIGAPVPECERPDRDRTLAQVRAELAADAAWVAGRAAPLHAVTGGYSPSITP